MEPPGARTRGNQGQRAVWSAGQTPRPGPGASVPTPGHHRGHSAHQTRNKEQVFRVEVLCSGRRHTVPRRYSEFHALHKRIKKLYKVPDFPSKRLPNWRTRGLEQRRQGLEAYIQGILYLNQDVPKELLEFLRLRHFPTDSKASNWGSQLHHRPVIRFCVDPYIYAPSPEPLPEMVVNGVLQGLYGFSTSPSTQPTADPHPALPSTP